MALLALRDKVAIAEETLRARHRTFEATPEVSDAEGTRLLEDVPEQQLVVTAEGQVADSLARSLPGVGLERKMRRPAELKTRPTIPPERGEELATLLDRYDRAHLIGPGLGGELFEGIMLAPAHVNRTLQSLGIEEFMRVAQRAGCGVKLKAKAYGRRLLVPLANNKVETVDILTRVEYTVTVTHPDPPRAYGE
jgi:hypothetical protein